MKKELTIYMSLPNIGESYPHFEGFFAILWKYFLASLCFLLRIKTVGNYLR